MSRRTFFKELAILKEKGEIIVKNKNKRDKVLFVNKNNLLITVPKELEQFEKDFLKLAETISCSLEKTLFLKDFNNYKKKWTNAESKFAEYLSSFISIIIEYFISYS